MAPAVLMEHGAITMPSVRKEPEAIEAPMSRTSCRWWASASTSATVQSVSSTSVRLPATEMTRCVSRSSTSRSISRRRMP